ncbi:hypothetical protein PRIC1_002710 [Phytophthora ramorum]
MSNSTLVTSDEYQIFPSKYAYLVPYFNSEFHGRVTRIELDLKGKKRPRPARFLEFSDYETPNGIGPYANQVTVIDMAAVDPAFKGFYGGFTAFSKAKIDNFSSGSVEVLDLAAINPHYVGFSSAITYGNYTFLVPFRRSLDGLTMNLREFPVSNSGLVVRIDLTTFRVAGSLDLAEVHPDLCGFSGAVTVTHYAYFVPYMRVREPASQELNPYSGLVARVNLRDFVSVQYLNLTAVDSGLRGFMRGFAYRQYVFLVPHRALFLDPKGPTQSGKVARIDTNNFTPSGVSYLDLTTALRSQVPNFADSDLRGFSGGVVSGKYGFFIPYFNGATFSGKVCRINLDKFDEVQTLDLTQLDSELRGFADGIVSKVEEALEANLFDEFQIRVGTTDPYDYKY